jgi:hypothetical protein
MSWVSIKTINQEIKKNSNSIKISDLHFSAAAWQKLSPLRYNYHYLKKRETIRLCLSAILQAGVFKGLNKMHGDGSAFEFLRISTISNCTIFDD